MKPMTIFAAAMALASMTVYAADSAKDTVTSAAKALEAKPNYSWKSTTVVPESAQLRPGPTEGQTEKDGFTVVKMTFGDNEREIVKKGEKIAYKGQDGWQTMTAGEGGRGAMMFRNFKAPAAQAQELVTSVQDLKKEGDMYSGDMTEAGAKSLMTFRRGGQDGEGPTVTNPKGSAKFWVKDGALTKYEFKVTGKVNFNGNDMDVDRDTTVEIKDVGTTKVSVPEEAKKALQ